MARNMRMPKGMKKIRSIILVCGMMAGIILTVPELRAYAEYTEKQDSTTTIDSVSSSAEPEASSTTTESTAQVSTSQNEQTTKSTEMTSPKTTKDDSEEWSFALLAVFSTVFFGCIVIRRKINKLDELE